MWTIWYLVFVAGDMTMTLHAYPTKQECLEVKSHAVSKIGLSCVGVRKNDVKAEDFSLKYWS